MFIADIWDHFPKGFAADAFWFVVCLLSLGILILTFWNLAVARWGRKPPLNSILREINRKLEEVQKKIGDEMKLLVPVTELIEYKEEVRLRCLGLEKQVSDARHSFDERANSDLKRTMETFQDIIGRNDKRDETVAGLSRLMARMQERTESHLRKFDQYDTKLDNLLRDVTAAAARGVREASK